MTSSLIPLLVALLCIGAVVAHPFETDQEDQQEDVQSQLLLRPRRPWYPVRSVIKVKFAYYGLSCAKGILRKSTQIRSTQWIARLCNGKSYCSGRVHNSVLSDPYRGCPKDFLVVAQCSNGKVIAKSVAARPGEGQRISLSCPRTRC